MIDSRKEHLVTGSEKNHYMGRYISQTYCDNNIMMKPSHVLYVWCHHMYKHESHIKVKLAHVMLTPPHVLKLPHAMTKLSRTMLYGFTHQVVK